MQNRFSDKLGRVVLSSAVFLALSSIAMHPAHAQTFNVIYTFTGGADGGTPFATPILYNGYVYGTTYAGGAYGNGTIYALNFKTKKETVLHSFAGGPSDGAAPIAGLVQDPSGNFYGAAYKGGAYNFGAIFKLTTTGTYSLLHSFAGPPNEGLGPSGTPVFDSGGDLFGTTYQGGNTRGYGTTWEISRTGVYTTGHSFPSDGALPRAGLRLESGQFWGTTYGGSSRSFGGTVYLLGSQTPLYNFTGGADGGQPGAPVIGDGHGNLYGTTEGGGSGRFGSGNGVIFKVNITTGQETVLHTFTGADGAVPLAGLTWDTAGNLYGTTSMGGAYGNGTVFKLDSLGNLTTIYSFTGGADGGNPNAGVLVDNAGNIWGAAASGGASGYCT